MVSLAPDRSVVIVPASAAAALPPPLLLLLLLPADKLVVGTGSAFFDHSPILCRKNQSTYE